MVIRYRAAPLPESSAVELQSGDLSFPICFDFGCFPFLPVVLLLQIRYLCTGYQPNLTCLNLNWPLRLIPAPILLRN